MTVTARPTAWYALVAEGETLDRPGGLFKVEDGLCLLLTTDGWVETPSLIGYPMRGEPGAEPIDEERAEELVASFPWPGSRASAKTAAQWTKGDDGRFTGSESDGDTGMTDAQKAATVPVDEVGNQLQDQVTAREWGHIMAPGESGMSGPSGEIRWGATDLSNDEWAVASAKARDALNEAGLPGQQIQDTAVGWSYGADVGLLRDAYDGDQAAIDYLSETNASEGAAGLFNLVRNSDVEGPLYRGVVIDELDLQGYAPGKEIQGALTSWSRSQDVAELFTQPELVNRQAQEPVKVLLTREGGKGVDIAALGTMQYAWQQEVVSADALRIASIDRGADGVVTMRVEPVARTAAPEEEPVGTETADLLLDVTFGQVNAEQAQARLAALSSEELLNIAMWAEDALVARAEAEARTAAVDYIQGEDGRFQGSRPQNDSPETKDALKDAENQPGGLIPTHGASREELIKRGQQVDAIIKANKHLDTERVYNKDKPWDPGREEQHDTLLNDWWQRERLDEVPRDREAIIMGGLPGAGKSSILRTDELGVDAADFITVNPDDWKTELVRNGMEPHDPALEGLKGMEKSFLLHEESSHLAGRLMTRAVAEGRNVLLDGTLGGKESAEKKIALLQENGYNVRLVFVDTPIGTSQERALNRYVRAADTDDGGRYVPPEIIADQYDSEYGSVNRRNYEELKDQVDGYQLWENIGGARQIESS